MSAEYDDEDYFLPLEDQRVFGAGIRRKRVPFVRSGELSTTTSRQSASNVADTYLSIVMKQQNKPSTSPSTPKPAPSEESTPPPRTHSAPPSHTSSLLSKQATIISGPAQDESETKPSEAQSQSHPSNSLNPGYCEVCSLPIAADAEPAELEASTRPHEASLAHQVCLQHSHPPSHLDRTRAGMRYLSTYGWDPDSRLGLGAAGREGIREPLKGRVKNDTAGLGSGLDKDGDPIKVVRTEPKKVVKLNAKEVRKKELEAKRRGEKMRNLFFQSDEVLKYLGEEA